HARRAALARAEALRLQGTGEFLKRQREVELLLRLLQGVSVGGRWTALVPRGRLSRHQRHHPYPTAVQGPRLETAAEINRIERDGADMVGMTGMPEAYLARELSICYATVGAVVNHAAGRGPSANGIRMEEIQSVLGEVMTQVRHLLEQLVTNDAAGLCKF
ncbi:MAG TPA: hypothetical protein VF501_00025, partial [Thiobacillus sp.]